MNSDNLDYLLTSFIANERGNNRSVPKELSNCGTAEFSNENVDLTPLRDIDKDTLNKLAYHFNKYLKKKLETEPGLSSKEYFSPLKKLSPELLKYEAVQNAESSEQCQLVQHFKIFTSLKGTLEMQFREEVRKEDFQLGIFTVKNEILDGVIVEKIGKKSTKVLQAFRALQSIIKDDSKDVLVSWMIFRIERRV